MISRFFTAVSNFFKHLFEKDLAIKLISIIAAVLIWFMVSISVYPTIERVIYNVPITIEMTGTYAEAHNFKVISQSDMTATVYITGDRGQIGDLTNEELTLVASAENVITATEYNLQPELVCSSDRELTVVKISPEYVTVDFDEIVTKEVNVKPMLDDIHIASGFICDEDEVVIVPDKIEITGAKDTVSEITDAYVPVSADSELSTTYEYSASEEELVYYCGNTPLEPKKEITAKKAAFTVQIPILQKQTLPLVVLIKNAPTSFNVEAFSKLLEFSATELEVAAPSENIKDISAINIGSIDMREVDIGSVFTFKTADFLPEGYQNLSGLETVTVTCPSEGLVKIPLSIRGSAIQIINAPSQFEYNIITSGFTPFFIGPAESIEQLSYIDVVAQIDLINDDLEARDYKFPVTFSTPAYDDIWCIGSDGVLSPKATVTVTVKAVE